MISAIAGRSTAIKGKAIQGCFIRVSHVPGMLVIPTTNNFVLSRNKSTRPDLNRDNDATNSLLNYTAVSDWFVQLRWKAAKMLTASLSDKEREELLHRMNLPPSSIEKSKTTNDGDVTCNVNHSIAEAVAAARAQEIKLNQERWEREKEKLFRDAENAARERIESDLLIQKRQIAFEQWKKGLAEATEAEKKSKEEAVATLTEEDTKKVLQEDVEELHPHPILGPCVLDLGYKRLHVVKAHSLAAIPVWEKQRIYRHDRARTMAADKLKTLHLGMPGVIGLYENSDGKLFILDGQHRVGMFTILEGMKKDATNNFLEKIVVEVYTKTPPSEESHVDASTDLDSIHAKEIFLEINKAEPIKFVDIPGVVKGSDRKMLNDAVDQLHDEFTEMFRTSTKCHPPHVNIDNVRDALFAANVISRHKMKSTKHLFDWLIDQNDLLAQKYNNNGGKTDESSHATKALEKAVKYNFYLGLESSWYYN
jgi:hypothetical protein